MDGSFGYTGKNPQLTLASGPEVSSAASGTRKRASPSAVATTAVFLTACPKGNQSAGTRLISPGASAIASVSVGHSAAPPRKSWLTVQASDCAIPAVQACVAGTVTRGAMTIHHSGPVGDLRPSCSCLPIGRSMPGDYSH